MSLSSFFAIREIWILLKKVASLYMTLYRRQILKISGFSWEKGALFSSFHNGDWKLKKGFLFSVLSIEYKWRSWFLGVFHFVNPRFLQKIELPEPTTDCCEALNCVFPVDAQNEIELLARFLSYSWLVCLLFFWLRNAPLVKVIGNPISDESLLLTSPSLMLIIKRVQKSRKRFWWPSGAASWLVSLSYFFFSGFLKSSVVSAPSLCTRQWSDLK